ncbi:MAG: hypothetical protein FD181_306 [Prolixibacteraceae bacterium]|nr:MAG: hypothetical protein FD181_306 [Prolixibacteraceae bacterium]
MVSGLLHSCAKGNFRAFPFGYRATCRWHTTDGGLPVGLPSPSGPQCTVIVQPVNRGMFRGRVDCPADNADQRQVALPGRKTSAFKNLVLEPVRQGFGRWQCWVQRQVAAKSVAFATPVMVVSLAGVAVNFRQGFYKHAANIQNRIQSNKSSYKKIF